MRLLLLTLCIILFGGNTLRLEAKKHFFSNYNFCHITEEAGLPNNSVTAVMKDSFGYIWVATQDGLARYDGYRFLSYGVKEPLYRLKGNYVYTLCEDRQKRLWVGSDAGLDLIDLQTGLSVSASDLGAAPELSTLFNSFVRSVVQTTDGNIWVVTDKMLWCLELEPSGVVTAFYRMQAEADENVSAIAEIEGGVCAGVGNCIYRIVKEGGNKLRKQQLSDVIVPFSDDWRISCLQADGDFLWIGSNRGLFRYYRQTKTMKRYRYSSHREGMLSQAYITDMKLTSDGSLVVSTFNGLNVYDRESDTFSFIRRVEDSEERGLNSNIIVCLFTDGQDIWAGTQDGGVNLLYLSRRLEVSRLGDIPWKLSAGRTPQISAVTEDKKGNLWIGTIEGGLYQMNPETEAVQHYAFTPHSSTSILSNNVNGILIDSDNHLWVYTWGAGISELDLNKPHSVFRQHSNGEVPGLEDDFIMSAVEDSVNRGIWFGTTHGLLFYDRSDLNLCISIKMLSNSVQIELFIILWVTKLIHNKQPMYAVLDKDTIKNEILPHLSVAKRGFQSKSSLIEVINAILYKLKTGCQWEYLPVKELFSGKVLKYGAVFHHYNKWSKKGEWKSLWLQLLDKHRSELDMSSVDLDGSHTPAIRGGEEVGYQGRKKRKTTNALYLTDRKGLPLAMSVPKSGEHHDTHNIVAVMQNMMEDMAKANIRTDGLFLNADAGFDCAALRSVLKSYGIVSNICINKRNGTTNDSIVLDELLYRERYSIERTNAWMDSFRTILNRFDTTLRNWESWNYIAFSVMLLRKCARKRKV